MARYIDADKLIEHINNMPWKMDSASEITKFIFLSTVEEAPTADVVPKSEVKEAEAEIERLKRILDCYALQYGTVMDKHIVIERARSEVAREIFEEIEKVACVYKLDGDFYLDNGIYTELKKKYTEGE